MGENKDRRIKRSTLLLLLLLLITLASICVTIYFTFFYEREPSFMPDYMPVEQDEEVLPLIEPPQEKMDLGDKAGGAVIICNQNVLIHAESSKIDMSYQNPERSRSSVVLQIVIDDVVIAQSGSIHPGYILEEMELFEDIELKEGGYNGILRIAFYDPDSGEKATVDTEVEAFITVMP